MLHPPQFRLFTPWPTGAADALYRRASQGPQHRPNRLIVAGVDVGVLGGWRVAG